MSMTQTDLDNMFFGELCQGAAYKLGWQTPLGTLTWQTWCEGLAAILPMRLILYPILEPDIDVEPRTVYCSGSPNNSTNLVSEALIDAGLSETNETEKQALVRCFVVWLGL